MYFKYLSMHFKSSLEYRHNTFMVTLSSVIVSVGELLAIYVMFKQFETVGNWGFYESALMFGIITAVFAFAECFARGYDEFATLIKNGDLDRMLVRPVNIHKQIFSSKIEFTKLARFILGIAVCVYSLIKINITWTFFKVIVLIATFICGVTVIWGLFMIGAGVSIYTVENLEFINIITNGSKEISFYPLNIYNKWLTRIFTFVIPMACFNYLPVTYLLSDGSVSQIWYALSPFIGILFCIPCLLFLNFSLKKYQSTGTWLNKKVTSLFVAFFIVLLKNE